MKGSGGSVWPTAATRDHHAQGANHNEAAHSSGLATVVEATQWQTPVADDQMGRMRGKFNSRGEPKLSAQALQWTTPQAHDVTQRGSGQVPSAKAGNACLARDATTWPTPASMWMTPRTVAGEYTRDGGQKGMERPTLEGQAAATWPTPVAQGFSRPDLETAHTGRASCDPRLTWRRLRRLVIASHGRAVWKRMAASGGRRWLNPNFVEWLMGWPPGHSLCASSETALSLWLQRMRGALSQLPMASGPWIWAPPKEPPQPVQRCLFDEVAE